MKRIWTALLLALVIAMSLGMYALAGTFDGYWDFEQPDGNYAYGFERVLVTMDEDWYHGTIVVNGENGRTASFYHKDSYEAWADEGMVGGLLFTLGASVNTDFKDLPSFVYLGFDEEEAMNYFAVLPTDYQAYAGDEEIRAGYDALWSGVDEVLDNIVIKGSEKYAEYVVNGGEPEWDPEYSEPETASSGDYDYCVNEDGETVTITKYSGKDAAVEIPSEIDGYTVTGIGYQAFTYQKMQGVTFPESIKNIGERSFEYCTVSEDLVLPEGAAIAKNAFSYAKLPADLTIPAGAVLADCAFSYCETIEKVFVEPDAVIGGRAISYCSKLKLAVCADGSTLEKRAFENCRKLEQVVFCGSVEAEEASFSSCGEYELIEEEKDAYETWKQGGGSITEMLTGGWQVTRDSAVTEEAQAVFDQAMPDHDQADYEAVALLATQAVAGRNYCFLRRTSSVDSGEAPTYQLVYIWEDLKGEAHLLEVKEIRFGLSEDAGLVPAEPDEIALEIIGSPAEVDGVTLTIDEAAAVRKTEPDRFEYSLCGTIENDTDEGIMQVQYVVTLIDENGEEFRWFVTCYDGMDKSIPPHETIEFTLDGFRWGPQSVPAAVKVEPRSVKTETELPPVYPLQEGDCLYEALGNARGDENLLNIKEEPPVKLLFHVDQGGYGRTATFEKGPELDKAIDLFCRIRIGEESGEFVTDNYNGISLEWADGSRTSIGLNLRNLEYTMHSQFRTYELENLGAFWDCCAEYLEED